MAENKTPLTAEQVLADIGYEGFVRSLFNRTGDPSKDFAHAVLGITTEIHELRHAADRVNQIEEAGDLLFYGQALALVVDDFASLDQFSDDILQSTADTLVSGLTGTTSRYVDHLCNILQDHAKRWVGYGKAPVDMALPVAIAATAIQFTLRDHALDDDENEIELVNVKKLLKRYNGITFSAERAVNRDTGAERKVLEDAVSGS